MSELQGPNLEGITHLYEDSLAKHGTASLGVGWRDEHSHEVRFAKLAQLIDQDAGPITINDLGCGYGAFEPFLRRQGLDVRHFRGYDISEKMLAIARERLPSGEFLLGSVLGKPADYSFACGIFNVRLEATEEAWRTHVERTLENMYEQSTRGFAFNLLSTYVDFREPHLYYGDPCYFFDLCKRRFSRRVSLLHDYPLYEWTLLIKR